MKALSSSTLIGDRVVNEQDEDLGHLRELMIDLDTGSIAYAVIGFGGLLGAGEKLFAIRWSSLRVDQGRKCLLLDQPRETFEMGNGFDPESWPDGTDLEETLRLQV